MGGTAAQDLHHHQALPGSRQLFSLELVHSIPARTVLVTHLPGSLRAERPLAEYFENMGLAVESVTVCREVGSLKRLLDKRTTALLELEAAWTNYVGNPSTVEEYDPENMGGTLVDVDIEGGGPQRLVVPHRRRPRQSRLLSRTLTNSTRTTITGRTKALRRRARRRKSSSRTGKTPQAVARAGRGSQSLLI